MQHSTIVNCNKKTVNGSFVKTSSGKTTSSVGKTKAKTKVFEIKIKTAYGNMKQNTYSLGKQLLCHKMSDKLSSFNAIK